MEKGEGKMKSSFVAWCVIWAVGATLMLVGIKYRTIQISKKLHILQLKVDHIVESFEPVEDADWNCDLPIYKLPVQ